MDSRLALFSVRLLILLANSENGEIRRIFTKASSKIKDLQTQNEFANSIAC
jgi:hypothetical protein